MIRSRQTRTERADIVELRRSQKKTLASTFRQLCVRKHEAEEGNGPLMLFSSSPGGAVEVGVLESLLDLVQQVPARGAARLVEPPLFCAEWS